jgi:phage protein U
MTALLALGYHVFEIEPLNYNKLQQQVDFRWATLGRLGTEPARQFIGPGNKSITINGLLFPNEFGGYEKYRAIEFTAHASKAVMLVGGSGHVFGRVAITKVSETQNHIGLAGQPAMVKFNVTVERYGGAGGGMLAVLF